jgi:hypothetical protein
MATVYKNAQTVPTTAGVTNYKVLYNTGASTTAVISTIAICNQSAGTVTYRIAIDNAGGTSAPASAADFFVYDATAAANDTIFITVGLTLGNSEYLKVSGSSTSMSFTAFISEIS